MERIRRDDFIISLDAQEVYEGFISYLKDLHAYDEFKQSLKASSNDREGQLYLVLEWLCAYQRDLMLKNRPELEGKAIYKEMSGFESKSKLAEKPGLADASEFIKKSSLGATQELKNKSNLVADVYNLGDMLRENEEAFKLSYIENSITSNPVLNKLSNRSRKDIAALIELAKGAERESIHFEDAYSVDELHEYTTILQKLFKVQNIVLKVNMAYIYSAAQADIYRNEPPFKLQGSYRNMNKIAERVVSVMNDDELDELVLKSYENDAQTLATDAEANLLKWKEILGTINDEELKRWVEIKEVFLKNKLVKGDDKMGQTVMIMDSLNSNIEKIKEILAER